MEILLFTGYSASGKSTLAKKLSEYLGYEFISVRQLLHPVAVQKGYERIRHWIAQEGAESVIQASRVEIVRAIKEREQLPGVVVDDNFDRGLYAQVKENFPRDRVVVIAITVDESRRELQMAGRLGDSIEQAREEIKVHDGFKLQAGINEVLESADVTVANEFSPESTLAMLLDRMEARGVLRRGIEGLS